MTSNFRSVIFGMIVLFANSNAMGADDSSKAAEWDSYLQSIDQYTTEPDRKSATTPTSKSETPVVEALKSRPLESGATPKQVSEYNRKLQKALRDQQKEETEHLYEKVDRADVKKADELPKRKKPFTMSTSPSSGRSGYSAKEANFSWGGEAAEYEYTEYEISFESTNTEHAERMMAAMNEMAQSGWEVDLNRSFQRVDGNDEKAKAYTTTQMRFRRKK